MGVRVLIIKTAMAAYHSVLSAGTPTLKDFGLDSHKLYKKNFYNQQPRNRSERRLQAKNKKGIKK